MVATQYANFVWHLVVAFLHSKFKDKEKKLKKKKVDIKYLADCVKSDISFNKLVLKIPIEGNRNTNNLQTQDLSFFYRI